MSERAQNRINAALVAPVRSGSGGALQRMCACGNHTMGGGECGTCGVKREMLQRKPSESSDVSEIPPITHDVLSLPSRPLGMTAHSFMESGFESDFSRLPARRSESDIAESEPAINEPGDRYEQEADRAAQEVMRMPSAAPPLAIVNQPVAHFYSMTANSPLSVQRNGFEEDEPGRSARLLTLRLQRKETSDRMPDSVSDQGLLTGGVPLPPGLAHFYEQRFGRDFSQVRVHSGPEADKRNEAVAASAFTYGNHIWLSRQIRLEPSFTLAHELAHVVQQKQPPLINVAASNAIELSREAATPVVSAASMPIIQRTAYWEPPDKNGTKNHNDIVPVIGKKNKVFTEAPVPNAQRDKIDSHASAADYGRKGFADFYRSSGIVGIYFLEHDLPTALPLRPEFQTNGAGKVAGKAAGKTAAKAAAAPYLKFQGRKFEDLDQLQSMLGQLGRVKGVSLKDLRSMITLGGVENAPTSIEVGDLKPAFGTEEAKAGAGQIRAYLDGFKLARDAVNALPPSRRENQEWQPFVKREPLIDLEIPEQYKEPSATGQKSKSLVIKGAGDPLWPTREVQGKVFVKEDPNKNGIYNYVWKPNDPVDASVLPIEIAQKGLAVYRELIAPLSPSPVKKKGRAKHEHRQGRPLPALSSIKGEKRIRRRAADEEKDSFDRDAFERWKQSHQNLRAQEFGFEKTPEFKETRFKALAIEAQEATKAAGFNVPAPKGQETLKTIRQIQFWTRASSYVFGHLRYWFGFAFVKIANAYHSIRARFQNLLDGKSAPDSSGLPGTIIKIAFNTLKSLGRIFIERTAGYLVTSLKTGVAQKLKSLIPIDEIDQLEAKVDEVKAIAEDLERRAVETVGSWVEAVIGPFEGYISTIIDAARKVSIAAKIIEKVRWGARMVACLSPPGWGCLWIVAQPVLERFASYLIDSCWFKKKLAPLVMSFDFIADLPKNLAGFIIEQIRNLLPQNLQDVFAKVNPSEIEKGVNDKEICDLDDLYPRDRFLLEKLALEELRKEIGEEKWQAWTTLGDRYGVNKQIPLTEEQVVQLKRELKKASLPALKEAVALGVAFSPSNSVTSLTAFLEEAERVKEEMYGGGDEGGESGINATFSEKPLPGKFTPSKYSFQVVAGVNRGQYQGTIIKVSVATSIGGRTLTGGLLEVSVEKRILIPNTSNPERIEVSLKITKDQYLDLRHEKSGTFRFKQGMILQYTLQLRTPA